MKAWSSWYVPRRDGPEDSRDGGELAARLAAGDTQIFAEYFR